MNKGRQGMESEQRDEKALIPQTSYISVEEVQVFEFDGDTLLITLFEGRPYVAIKPISDSLQIDWSSQYQRIQDDDVLDAEQRLLNFARPDDIQERPMVALPLEFLHGWIFGISTKRLRRPTPEQKNKIQKYRRDCFRVLWETFGARSRTQQVVSEPSSYMAALTLIRDQSLAVAQMADEQIRMSYEVTRAHARLDTAAEVVGDMRRRLTAVERRVMPYETITEEQADDIKLAVQRLGELLTRNAANASKDKKIQNYYQGIFVEIHNLTGAPRYNLIRQERYRQVMEVLMRWQAAARGEDPDGLPESLKG